MILSPRLGGWGLGEFSQRRKELPKPPIRMMVAWKMNLVFKNLFASNKNRIFGFA